MTLLRSQHLGLGRGRSIGRHWWYLLVSATNAQFGTRGTRWVGMVTPSWRIVKYSQSLQITRPRYWASSMRTELERRGTECDAVARAPYMDACRRTATRPDPRSETDHRRRTRFRRFDAALLGRYFWDCFEPTDTVPNTQYLPRDDLTREVEFQRNRARESHHATIFATGARQVLVTNSI